jgi:hypothetical protein
MLFAVNLIGYGGGPYVTGVLSDVFMSSNLQLSTFAGELTPALCKGTAEALTANLGAAKAAACAQASAQGLGQALRWATLLFGVAGILYLIASRRMSEDLVARIEKS